MVGSVNGWRCMAIPLAAAHLRLPDARDTDLARVVVYANLLTTATRCLRSCSMSQTQWNDVRHRMQMDNRLCYDGCDTGKMRRDTESDELRRYPARCERIHRKNRIAGCGRGDHFVRGEYIYDLHA